MSDETTTTQRFIYAGRRLTVKGQLVHAWLPEAEEYDENDLRLFPKAKGLAVGGIYEIDAGETTYSPGSVSYTGDRVDAELRATLEAVDHADGVRHASAALEKNHGRQSEIKELCQPLRALVGRQVGWANRAALLQYITSEISRG